MDLVVIAHYFFAHEARISQSTLEAAGIKAYIRDENMVQMNWLYANAVGGAKLQVAHEDVDAALEVLATDFSEALEDEFSSGDGFEDVAVCPECGSGDVQFEVKGKEAVFLSALVFGAPVFPFSRGYRCLVCGSFWKGV